MHSARTPTRPQYRLSNTVPCSSRLSMLMLAESDADDDDCMTTLPVVASSGGRSVEPPAEYASLPELRPMTTSSSRCQHTFTERGGRSSEDGTSLRSPDAATQSPMLPGESGRGSVHRRPTASTSNDRGATVRTTTSAGPIVPPAPPSRLERTLRGLSSLQDEVRGSNVLSRTPGGGPASRTNSRPPPTDSRSPLHACAGSAEGDEAFLEQVRVQAAACAPTIPRFFPMSTKQALQVLQQAIRALVTARGADLGSVPTLLITTYNIVCKQVFNDGASVVRTDASEFANQPRSLFDTLAYGGEDTTIATELRDLQRELSLTKKHYHVAIQQIDIFKHRLNEHVAEIRRLEKAIDQANSVELDLRSNITALQQTIQSKAMECSELKSNIVALHSSMHDVQRSDHVRISERTADLRHELVTLYEQVRQAEEMTKSYEREVENLHGDVRRTEDRYEESQRDLIDTQSALAVRDDELYQLKLSNIELKDKIKNLEVHIEDLLVVQGDTMIQDKMIRENPDWHVYKESILNVERPRKLENVIIPSHIKFIRGFGVDETIPAWLRAEGKVKAKFLNKGDTVHVALQALTDLSLPASLASNLRALLKPPQAPQVGAVAGLGVGGQRASISFNREGSRGRDDLIFNSIGTASGPSSSGFGQRRSLQPSNGDVSLNELTSRLPFSDGFKCWLSRNGTDMLNNKQGTELAYGFHYSLQRWPTDPDLVLFDAILRGDVPPELHYHVYRCFDDLLQLFVSADEDMHKGDARKALPVTTVARVLKKAVHAMPCAYATDDDAEHLLFLMTLDFNIPYIPYRALFEYNEDGERNHFLQEYCSLVVDRTLEYYDVLQGIIEALGQDVLRAREAEAAADVQYVIPPALAPLPHDAAGDGASEGRRTSDPHLDSDLSSHGDHNDDDEPEEKRDYPGHGHPTRPIPLNLKDVEVSLQRFGELWATEDPAKADDIVDLTSLIRMTILSAEQAKKKAEEEAAAAAANPTRGRARFVAVPPPPPGAGGRRGTMGKSNPKEEAAPAADPNEPPRDLFTVQAMVAALRQLVVTRASHRLLMQQPPTNAALSDAGTTASGQPLSDPSEAAAASSTPVAQPFRLDDVDEPPLQLDMTVAAAHPTLGGAASDGGDGQQAAPQRPSVVASAHTPSTAGLPPPQPIQPRFKLEDAVHDFLNPNGAKGSPGRKPVRSLSSLLPSGGSPSFGGSFKEIGSVASQSLAGGGFGVPQSRAALQALAKRSQTVLPPFFKMRMMRH